MKTLKNLSDARERITHGRTFAFRGFSFLSGLLFVALAFGPATHLGTADQPVDPIPVAALSSNSGAATLYYNSDSNTYSVSWTLLPGEPDTRGDEPGAASWGIVTVLWDDSGRIIGCFTTGSDGIGMSTGGPLSGTVALTGCVEQDVVPREPSAGVLHWAFFGGFTSESSSADWVEKVIKWGLRIAAAAVSVVVIAAACVETVGLACAEASVIVGVVWGNVDAWVSQLDPWCDGSRCTYRTTSVLLNAETAIQGIPTFSLTLCEGGGHDTWNIVEELFYNRQPGTTGLGVTYPYDAAVYCVNGAADNAFLGLDGSVSDDVDVLLRPTVIPTSDPGDGPNTYVAKAIDAHHYQFSGLATGNIGLVGTFRFHVDGRWDYEWAGETKQRSYEAQNFLYVASDADPECGNCGASNSAGIDATHFDLFGAQDTIIQTLERKVWSSLEDPFDSPNPMAAEGTADGLLGTTTSKAATFVNVHFDVIPRVDCVVDCGGLPPPPSSGHVAIRGGFFLLSHDALTTTELEQKVRSDLGEHTKVFVLVDSTSTDWQDYAKSNGYNVVLPAQAMSGKIPAAPMVTIVQATPEL
jgi:hypothetical protein